MPSSQSSSVKGQENSSGVVRNGKGYIIDGKEVKGVMLRWKVYRGRIEAMEREAGYTFNKKGTRIPLSMIERLRSNRRNAAEAELPEEPIVQAESDSRSGTSSEKEEVVEETKKKSPKTKKKPAKRPRVK